MLLTVFSPYLGEACEAHIVGSDKELDLAVLEIPWHGHPALCPADANAVMAARTCRVLGLRTAREIEVHPKAGASWEALALDAVVAHVGARPEECFF